VSLLKNIKERSTQTQFCKIRHVGKGLNDDNAIIEYPELAVEASDALFIALSEKTVGV